MTRLRFSVARMLPNPKVDGGLAGLEEGLELGGEGALVWKDPGAGLETASSAGSGHGASVGSAAS